MNILAYIGIIWVLCGIFVPVTHAGVLLKIRSGSRIEELSREQLLAKKTYALHMTNSRAYLGVDMDYTAVRICDLLRSYHVRPAQIIELVSADNFYASVPAALLTSCQPGRAVAYIAIEMPNKPWPRLTYNNPDALQPDHGSAGPLAVVWEHPDKNYISNEYWAWKIVGINILPGENKADVIAEPQDVKQHIRNGYHAYVSRCSGCHTMNRIGRAKIGPDLNYPESALKHFEDDATVKRFIRDPQSVRKKPNDRMSGTSEQFLSNHDLDDLLAYMRFMAKNAAV